MMGDPRRLRPKYETPRKLWSKERIEEQHKLLEEYGLSSMRELWVMEKELKKIRREARKLLSLGERGKVEGAKLIAKCVRMGFAKEGANLDTLLALTIHDILERRLDTRVVKRGLARSMRQSRQLIAHGFISVDGRRVSSPSYLVSVAEEPTITYYKPIDINAPVMSQRSKSKEAETPNTAATEPSGEKPAEGAS